MTETGKKLAEMTKGFVELMGSPEAQTHLEAMPKGSSVTVRRSSNGLTVTIWAPLFEETDEAEECEDE